MIQTTDPARRRRLLMAAIAAGLILIMPAAIALQGGVADPALRFWLLAAIGLGVVIALPASLGLTALQWSALARPGRGAVLDDELSNRNAVKAMAVGYVVAVGAAGLALPMSVWLGWPAAPLLTAVLLCAVAAHAASFAWFERQGDDDSADD